MAGGVRGRGGMRGRGGGACMARGGACMAGGVVCGRGHAWQERRLLQRTVRILLECILVL